jgi:hypothetical protein
VSEGARGGNLWETDAAPIAFNSCTRCSLDEFKVMPKRTAAMLPRSDHKKIPPRAKARKKNDAEPLFEIIKLMRIIANLERRVRSSRSRIRHAILCGIYRGN